MAYGRLQIAAQNPDIAISFLGIVPHWVLGSAALAAMDFTGIIFGVRVLAYVASACWGIARFGFAGGIAVSVVFVCLGASSIA